MSALKLHEFTDGYYPQALTPLAETLMDTLDDLTRNVEGKLVIKCLLNRLTSVYF